MSATEATLALDWLGAFRRARANIGDVLAGRSPAEMRAEVGTIGEGGDRTLIIDAHAEQCVFDELDALHVQGARFTAISEERGVVDYGGDGVLVVIDPIDGSLNAKRGISHHALSIAVADGSTMADVLLGYVYDFGTRQEWRAERGAGAFRDGERLAAGTERRVADGRLEVVAIESAAPRSLAAAVADLQRVAYRVRALGTIAVSMCQVAAGSVDGMVTLRGCRAIDAAAAQLIVREAGGLVQFGPGTADPLTASLTLMRPGGPVLAAPTAAALAEIAALPVI